MRNYKNLTIENDCLYDGWDEALFEEILSHLDFPDIDVNVTVVEYDEKSIYFNIEYCYGTDEDGDGMYRDDYYSIRYWVDSQWPDFCVSYCLFRYGDGDNRTEIEDGAYKIVSEDGKGKCIPI